MVRISSAVASRKRKKRVLNKTKGQFGHRSKHFSQAKRSLIKGMVYSYRDRKVKKRDFRGLWIVRINAGCREEGITYSRFMNALKDSKIDVNRKVLAELAVNAPEVFKKLVSLAKEKVLAKAA
jgi:large subunit ribosomal protein L20